MNNVSKTKNPSEKLNVVWTKDTSKDKYEELFEAYAAFQKTDIKPKSPMSFWGYINKEKSGFIRDGISDVYDKLGDENNRENIQKILKEAEEKENKIQGEKIQAETEKSRKIEGEKADRLTGLLKLQDAFEAFKKDPKYSSNQGQRAFIGYLNESKAKVNDTSETYYGFTTDEIILNNGIMEKPTVESIKQEEAIHPDTENKIDTTAEKPETPEEKTLTITKTRLRQTIDRYIEKIKGLKNAKEDEKNTLKDEIKILKEELAKQKNDYEAAKNFFLGTTEYKTGELGTVPTRWIRWGKKTVKDGVVTRTLSERLQFSTLRRRMTINKLGKKFNKIGNDPIKGIRFIMGFDKDRFLRYTGIRAYAGVDQLGGNLGMQMTAEQFHYRFNRGKNIIFSILKKGENAENEKDAIAAIKNRINYYGYAYARQRANARVNPFLQAEKNAQKEDKIIQMNPALAA